MFDSVAHDDQVSPDEYVQPTIVSLFQNSSKPAFDCSDIPDSSSRDTEQNQSTTVVITARVADCVGGCQTEDQPEADIAVQHAKPTGSKTLPSVITSMTTSSITRSDSKHFVTMVTTTAGEVSIPVVHPTSSIVAKTTKTAYVSSFSSSPLLQSTRKTSSTVSRTTEPESISVQDSAKINRGLLSDVTVVSSSSSSSQCSKVNATEDDAVRQFSDPKVGELPKGLVQQRMKVL